MALSAVKETLMAIPRKICDQLHRIKRINVERSKNPSGVLLISSGGLGDSILFSLIAPHFGALAVDGEKITVVMQHSSAAVEFLFPDTFEILPLNYRKFIRQPIYRYSFIDKIFSRNFRLAISTDHLRLPTVDDTLIMAADAQQSFALYPRSWPKHDDLLLENRSVYTNWIEPAQGTAHRMIRWTELASALLNREVVTPKVCFDEHLMPILKKSGSSYIVFHPFSNEAERNFSLATWLKLAENLSGGREIILSAGPSDLEKYPEFKSLASLPSIEINTQELKEKLALFRGAQLVITVDTSVLHLAVGCGANTLCLASAAHAIDSIPYDERICPDNVTFLIEDMPCAGCLGNCIHPLVSGRYACIDAITPDQIVKKALEIVHSPSNFIR